MKRSDIVFQFHKGTIKTGGANRWRFLDFNSIKVRLKLSAFYMRICTYYHFNSIKVRLKRSESRN